MPISLYREFCCNLEHNTVIFWWRIKESTIAIDHFYKKSKRLSKWSLEESHQLETSDMINHRWEFNQHSYLLINPHNYAHTHVYTTYIHNRVYSIYYFMFLFMCACIHNVPIIHVHIYIERHHTHTHIPTLPYMYMDYIFLYFCFNIFFIKRLSLFKYFKMSLS